MNQDDRDWVDYRLKVLDKQNQEIGEACEVMAEAYDAWVGFMRAQQVGWGAVAPF